jgi:high potential iron-sulfur protein
MNQEKRETSKMSRRVLLRSAVCLAGAVPVFLITANSAQAAKMGQAAVKYQNSPKGSQNCANCKLFQAPSGCRSVEGPVSASGWCNIWVKK